jgi:hypothetical protein
MRLTRSQLAEVDAYLYSIVKYRETFQELKDHVLTALQDGQAYTFDIRSVERIVEEDFGGRENIIECEAFYKRSTTARYFKLLGSEMLNTFKWFGLVRNLSMIALCAILFFSAKSSPDISSLPFGKAMYIIIYFPLLIFLFQRFIADGSTKASILNQFLFKVWLFTAISGTLILQAIGLSNRYFHLNNKLELGLLFILYMFMDIFRRVYLNLYKDKIRILAV